MVLDKPRAGRILIVHGGESKKRSIRRTMDGMAWKLISSWEIVSVVITIPQDLVSGPTCVQRNDSPIRYYQTLIDLVQVNWRIGTERLESYIEH